MDAALPWILGVLAVIAGLSAIFRPMQEQIKRLLEGERERMNLANKVGQIEVRFAGIETQFGNLDERTLRIERAFDEKLRAMDEKIQMEYKAAEQRLDGLGKIATGDIQTLRADLDGVRDEMHALAISAARERGGK